MRYERTLRGTFLSRPNRFIAHCLVNGVDTVCHVKNTGRCRELLVPGAEVVLVPGTNPQRKTPYDLIAVWKNGRLINMDSQSPNAAAGELLKRLFPDAVIRPETVHGDSRFDFSLEGKDWKGFLEVKGVTLEENGIVRFPDAPTERGAKHLRGLARAVEEGYRAYVLFLIQMEDVKYLAPNDKTDPEFGRALREAAAGGVQILAYDCAVTEDSMTARDPVPVFLNEVLKND